MNLMGQLDKIDKVDETVALPTIRNYSPEEELRKDQFQIGTVPKQSRNALLPNPSGYGRGNIPKNHEGTLRTFNMLPMEE